MAVSEDASTPAVATSAGGSTATSLTSASFSPPANSFLVALCAINYNAFPGSPPTITCSDTIGSGTWTAGPTINSSASGDLVAILTRPVSSAPGSITVTMSRGSDAGAAMLMLAVRVCDGTASSQAGAGNNTNSGSTTTAFTGSITTTQAGSAVYVVTGRGNTAGGDTANGASAILSGGDVHDTTDGGWLTVGRQNPYATGTPGAETLGWTGATNASYVWAALEILPAGASTPFYPATQPIRARLSQHQGQSQQIWQPGLIYVDSR